MSKIVREDIDALNTTLTITIEKEDYEQQFEEELQKYRKNVALKGFRKGKTPANVLRKMYGRSVLGEVINNVLNRELFTYIEEQNLETLGQPLPSKDQSYVDFDVKNLEDYEFKFDIGLAPDFELNGISPDDKYERYEVEVPESVLDEDLMNLRKRVGERVQVEEHIQEGDFVKFEAKELDGGSVKEGGLETDFGIMVNEIENEDFKASLFTKKVGDTINANVYELFDEPDDHYIRHHLLKLDHDDHDTEVGQEFELTLMEATRNEPADLNQEFFDKAFGEGKVTSEEEAKDLIREDAKQFYSKQADALLFRDIQERLMEINDIPLPDDFLKRWLKANNEKLTDEVIEKEYDIFAKNWQWTLLRTKLAKKFEVEITEQDIREGFAQRVRDYFGGYGNEELVNATVDRLMQDQKQVNDIYEEVLVDRLSDAITGVVTVVSKPVDREAFMNVLDEARARAKAEQESAVMASDEEE